jgi:hypothetical protein
MDRRTFHGALASSLLVLPHMALGQPVGKVPVLGVLITDSVGVNVG